MKKIKKLATGSISRNLKLMKLAASGGRELLFSKDKDLKTVLQGLLKNQADRMVNEMGLMKGSIMKVGQMLSLYSEALLPQEIKDLFAQLENKSFYLDFDEIKKNIPKEFFSQLDIESTPLAAASLGQVHKAIIKESKQNIVLKIQYKGVRKGIKNDLRLLKWLVQSSQWIPSKTDISFVFSEVELMLWQETDYEHEVLMTKKFYSLLEEDFRFIVPKIYEEFCSEKIIAQEYMQGLSLRKIDELKITQAQRNQLGENFFELFFMEIFQWGLVQTDPNPANYLLQKNEQDYQFILLDFGASKSLDENLKNMYKNLIYAVIDQDFDKFVNLLVSYQYLDPSLKFNRELFKQYFDIISEPFTGEVYDWGESNIPTRVLKLAPLIIKELSIYRPPKDIVFIDRKIGGVFFILKLIKAQFNPVDIAKKFQ